MKEFQARITRSGLKKVWIVEQLKISASSLTLYLKGDRQMPETIRWQLDNLLKKYNV